LLLAAASVATVTPVPTQASAPPTRQGSGSGLIAPDAELVYQAGGVLHVATAAGDAVWDGVTGVDGQQESPDWSPDGTQLVFHLDWASVWIADADGANARPIYECVAPCVFLQDPSWSADGRSIAVIVFNAVDDVATGGQIVDVDVDSGEATTLYEDTTGWKSQYGPRRSPDGASIVFEEDTWASQAADEEQTTAIELAVVELATGRRVQLAATGPDAELGHAGWSPDGSQIVFGQDGDLWLVDPDGSNLERLTDFAGTGGRALQPSFTPDGAAIMFTYESARGDVSTARAAVIAPGGGDFTTVGPDTIVTHARLRPTSAPPAAGTRAVRRF